MSLPFAIGDVVEIDEKMLVDPTLERFAGRRATVKTMGISWVKVAFEGEHASFIISNDNLKKVEDENTHRF
jgi:predicted thioesterase